MQRYRIYGLVVASDFPFSHHLLEEADQAAPVDLRLSLHFAPQPIPLGEAELVYESPLLTIDGKSSCRLFRHQGKEILCFSDSGALVIHPDGDQQGEDRRQRSSRHDESRLDFYLPDRTLLPMAELHILGATFAYWLERRERPCLHASAVAVDGMAVAFLASHGGGKTTTAATLVDRGLPLLTDDILPLQRQGELVFGAPSYPQMRFWPDLVAHFLPEAGELPRVRPELDKRRVPVGAGGLGSFWSSPLPLAAIFVPEAASAGEVAIEPLGPTEALVALLSGSFSPYLVEAVGLQAQRLSFFSYLIKSVNLFRLKIPRGLNQLPLVADRVVEEVRRRA